MSKKIKFLLIERGCSQTKLAEMIGTTQSNLGSKLARDNFSENDLIQIAEALDCDYDACFVMRDTGKRI